MAKTSKRASKKKLLPRFPDVSRKIRFGSKVQLLVRSAGLCEFPGCRRFLFEHHLTLTEGTFAQFAHIIAFGGKGPRASTAPRTKEIHEPSNLLLLCHTCHKLIDDNPSGYSVPTLRKYKAAHEDRIQHLRSLGPEDRTAVVQLKARVAGQVVDIPVDHVRDAVVPMYPLSKQGTVIDVTSFNSESASFYELSVKKIREEVGRLYQEGSEVDSAKHISLFALAPIPLLVLLGNELSSAVAVELYQRHRDTERWTWKSGTAPIQLVVTQLASGTDPASVALLLSLSGSIPRERLPSPIDSKYSIYEIRPNSATPQPMLFRSREDLNQFKAVYHEFLGMVTKAHPGATVIELFPAVPAPVAVMCGRELLRKKHPVVQVWDLTDKTGDYNPVLKVN